MMDLHPDDNVMVENIGTVPVTCKWDGRQWHIPPGAKASPSFASVCAVLGDPRSGSNTRQAAIQGTVYTIPSRLDEVHRLKLYHGQTALSQSTLDKFGLDNPGEHDFIPELTPKVRVTTLDGEELPVVVMDPHGKKVDAGGAINTIAQQETLLERMHRLEAQNRKLMDQLGLNELDPDEPTTSLPVDGEDEVEP